MSAIWERGDITKPVRVRDNMGGETVVYTEFATVWMLVKELSGREFIEARKLSVRFDASIEIRYLAGITPDMRVEVKGRVFELISPPIDPDGNYRKLHLMVKEVT